MKRLSHQEGVATAALVVGGLVVVLIGAFAAYTLRQPAADDAIMEKEEVMMKEDTAMRGDEMTEEDDADAMMGKDDAMMEEGESIMEEQVRAVTSFTGTVLAGSTAPLLEYNDADYRAALASDKLVVFYFYANWCPDCRAEFPLMQQAFNQLTGSDVVGFRVNFNDNETDPAERELAREYGVPYQHTKVFVRNGQQLLKSPEAWDTARYLQEIDSAR